MSTLITSPCASVGFSSLRTWRSAYRDRHTHRVRNPAKKRCKHKKKTTVERGTREHHDTNAPQPQKTHPTVRVRRATVLQQSKTTPQERQHLPLPMNQCRRRSLWGIGQRTRQACRVIRRSTIRDSSSASSVGWEGSNCVVKGDMEWNQSQKIASYRAINA